MPQISRNRALAYAGAVLVVLALGGRQLLADEPAAEHAVEPAALVRAEPAPTKQVLVHVVGAVRAPGLYRLEAGSRIDDALAAAGGPRAKAALELVNLAAPVVDGQQIVVPRQGAAGVAGVTSAGEAGPAAKVHLNTATLEELDTLPGVGPVTAQKILDYRDEHGAFGSIDELDAVPGIGPARLAELRELVEL
jgi:competence protein ComEA